MIIENLIDRKLIGICGRFKTAVTKLINSNIQSDYFADQYQPIVKEMLEYYAAYFELITPDTLSQILLDQGKEPSIVSASVATFEELLTDEDLVKDQSSINELDYFIHRIKQRKVLKICEDASKKIASAVVSSKIDAAKDLMMKTVINIDKVSNTGEIQEGNLSDFVDLRIKKYEDRKNNPEKYKGVQSGFPVLDQTTDGFQPGDLIIYCAESGAGKSANILHTAYSAWNEKYVGAGRGANVVLFTIEMDWYQYLRRWDSRDALVDSYKLKSASLDEYEYQTWIKRLEYQKNKQNLFYIVDIPSGCTALYIRNKLDEIRMKFPDHPIDLVAIDYLGIMNPSNEVEGGDWLKQGIISQECKELARHEKVAVLTAVQETRDSIKDNKTKTKTTAVLSRSQMIVTNANLIVYMRPHQIEEKDEDFKIFDSYNERPNVVYYQTIKSREGQKVQWKCGASYKNMLIQPISEEKDDEKNAANDPIVTKKMSIPNTLDQLEDEEEFGGYYNKDDRNMHHTV